MFERFTKSARASVTGAQEAARRLKHDRVGTQHMLLGLLGQPTSVAGRALADLAVTAADVEREILAALAGTPFGVGDAEALSAIGINLDKVRRRIEATFGKDALGRRVRRVKHGPLSGHIPFTPRNKKVLELSLREALALGHNYIGTEHILLGLVREGQGLAMQVLTKLGVSPDVLRTKVLDELRKAG